MFSFFQVKLFLLFILLQLINCLFGVNFYGENEKFSKSQYNIAKNSPIINITDFLNQNYDASHLTDETYFLNAFTGSCSLLRTKIIVDLKIEIFIYSISLLFGDRFYNLKIFFKLTAITESYEERVFKIFYKSDAFNNPELELLAPSHTHGRYIRIDNISADIVQICDIKVFTGPLISLFQ